MTMIRSSILGHLLLCGMLFGQSSAPTSNQSQNQPSVTQSPAPAAKPTPAPVHYHPTQSRRANLHYALVWGVDSLSVKWTESGEVIRFSYRVLDPDKAQQLNDKKAEPSLIDPNAGVKLVVPSL